jgi:hypothetical protein
MYHPAILERLSDAWEELTPEAQKAAPTCWRTRRMSASRPCARLPRRPPSSPTRWCAWHDRWGSKATRISANRSGRRSDRARRAFRTGRAGCRISRPRRNWAGSMPRWSAARSRTLKTPSPRSSAEDLLKQAAERSGPPAGLHTGCRGQQRQCPQFHLSRLHRHGRVPRHPARSEFRHRRSRLGRIARCSDRHHLQALSPRGGRGGRSRGNKA